VVKAQNQYGGVEEHVVLQVQSELHFFDEKKV
jgi:hypothetical protein